MPLYEYACQSCGHEFELLVRGSEAPACPSCQSGELHRRISVFRTGASSTGATASPGPVDSCGVPGDLSPGARGPNYEIAR
jgi:putative FmdB family regulatory protein